MTGRAAALWLTASWARFVAVAVTAAVVVVAVAVVSFAAKVNVSPPRPVPNDSTSKLPPENTPPVTAAPTTDAPTDVATDEIEVGDEPVGDHEDVVDTGPAETVAAGFVAAWLSGGDPSGYTTDDLATALDKVAAPRRLAKATTTGQVTAVPVSAHLVEATVPTSKLTLTVTVEYDGTQWLVTDVEPA